MKKLIFTLAVFLLVLSQVQAQNPYAALGIEEEVLHYDDTHEEVFGNDTLKTIGYAIYDRVNGLTSLFDLTDSLVAIQKIDPSKMARFLSVDPIAREYPWYTPYQFAGNKVIWAVDLDGLEEYYAADGSFIGKSGTSTEMRIIANTEIIQTAKENLSHKNYNHNWLLQHSSQVYLSSESQEIKLLNNWALIHKPKIDDREHAMSLFTKTLIKDGKSIEVLIPGELATGPRVSEYQRAAVNPSLSVPKVNGINIAEKYGWKRSSTIHTHLIGDTEFSNEFSNVGGYEGDIPWAINNDVKVLVITPYENWAKVFDPEIYKQKNPAGMNKGGSKAHFNASEEATQRKYFFIQEMKE